MKLLLDENLSQRLIDKLADLYPGSLHVADVGLASATDTAVWEYARDNGLIIVSKDSDFHQRSFVHGAPPKVICIGLGNCTTRAIEEVLRAQYARILQFVDDPVGAFLLLSQ